ncbi:MAG: C40 family peptidase [Brevinematales bacterium]|nr:C40 family peptidase [Brevinematales bacterium]
MRILILFFLFSSFAFSVTENFYEKVVKIAKESIGLSYVPNVKGKNFTCDCIGFVRYVYYSAGVDITQIFGNGRGGVSSLYDGMEKRGWVYNEFPPTVGDLIFFDNTFDANRNRKWDDELTHIGIISGFGKHNTIFYIHYASGKVKEDRINLSYPNTHAFRQKDGNLYVINSHLRINRGEGYSKKEYLSSSFFRCFGRIPVRVKNE